MSRAGVTVAVATCGRPAELARCLDALAGGTRVPDEVIVVDQDPTGPARAVADASQLPVRYLPQERLGLSASRNLALRETRFRTLAVTDDDCVPDVRWTETLARIVDDSTPVATGSIHALGPASEGYGISLREGGQSTVFRGRVVPWLVGSGANTAGHVEVLRDVGGWDERLGAGSPGRAGEDIALIDSLLRSGVAIRFEPDLIVRHDRVTRARRLETRWSYGFGLGALLGLRLAKRDGFVLRMTAAYLRLHIGSLGRAPLSGDAWSQHGRALAGMVAGLVHGIRIRHDEPRIGR